MVSLYHHAYAAVPSNPNNISGQGIAVHSTLDHYLILCLFRHLRPLPLKRSDSRLYGRTNRWRPDANVAG